MSPHNRRLEDLYVVGKFIPFDDGRGDPVTVWLRKLNPIESTQAVRRANAERSKVRAARHDPESDIYLEVFYEVADIGDIEELVEYVALDELNTLTIQTEARLAEEEEWSKEDYLQGLRDAWQGGLLEEFLKDSEHPEAKRVFTELQRFDDAVKAEVATGAEAIKNGYRRESMEDLRAKAVEQMLTYRASGAWVDEFHRCEVWLGTFEEDTKTQYWPDRKQVDGLSATVLNKLMSEYAELSVDVQEGKDSEATPDSSNSSAPPDEAETVVSSGLAVVSP